MSAGLPMRHLGLVPDDRSLPAPSWSSTEADERPAVLRLCAGQPLLLGEDDVDLVDLVNSAGDLEALLLDVEADPDEYRLAEVAVEYFCTRYGIQRHGKGDRLKSLISVYRRYLVPFLVELDASRPAGRRGVADLRITHLETLPRVLAGERPLPAATVAGDLLKRRGIGCLFLSRDDAAAVTDGGATALQVTLASGAVALHTDARTGEAIIRTADLRAAGVLIEPPVPHGLARSTAGNVLRDLGLAIERARDHGAQIRGRFHLEAIEPLPPHRLREPKPAVAYVPLRTVADTNPHMRIVGQVVLWIARLVGARISEVYGLRVTDYVRDEDDRPWLVIDKQGGLSSLGRDPQTGKFRRQDDKDHTKTASGVRTVPLPQQLARLLDTLVAVFHTDAETARVEWTARLIPGLRGENTSGQSAFRTWLDDAQEATGVTFDPHDMRAALITDLKNAGIEERLAHYYAGHELPAGTIQDKHYDLGPYPALLVPIADQLQRQITEQLGTDDLRAATALVESWGTSTRRHRQSAWIEQQLEQSGWRSTAAAVPGLGRELEVAEVAKRIDKSVPYTRRLMSKGTIAAHSRPWGTREVWVAYEVDVCRYLDITAGTTIPELSAELGLSYTQTWHVLRSLDLIDPRHDRGAAIRLSHETGEQMRAEIRRRTEVGADAVTVAHATQLLNMAVGSVETLIRQGHLQLTDGPTDTRHRYVTRDSVTAYDLAHPATAEAAAGEQATEILLTLTDARRLLQVTRHQLSTLMATRQVRTGHRDGSRHLYVTASSAMAWAERTGRQASVVAVRSVIDSRRG